MGNQLSDLPNIGPVLEQQLIDVGITTLAQLQEVGSKQAWLRIKAQDPSACIHRLLTLEGAIKGIRKTLLPQETKDDLKTFYTAFHG